MNSVWVAFRYRDYRKDNDAQILGVYRKHETARTALRNFVGEFIDNDWENNDVFEGEDFINVGDDNDCEVFCIENVPMIED